MCSVNSAIDVSCDFVRGVVVNCVGDVDMKDKIVSTILVGMLVWSFVLLVIFTFMLLYPLFK